MSPSGAGPRRAPALYWAAVAGGVFERRGSTVADAYPLELAAHASLRIETQRAGETVGIDRRTSLQRAREAHGVVAEGEQTAAPRGRVAKRFGRRGPHLCGKALTTEHPRHVREHDAVDFLVGGGVRLVCVAERVGRNVAGQVKAQLRTQQARGQRLAGREDELDVGAAPRLELELLADGRLDALLARAAVVGAQHLHDAGARSPCRRR